MKELTWTPIAIHVAERSDKLVALIFDDPGELVCVPMARADARELGESLVALADELDQRFGAEPAAVIDPTVAARLN